ncbi:hypothetical protein [Streptomyces sp. NPDC001135]
MIRRIATAVALSIAAAGLMGLGAGTASATGQCSHLGESHFGAVYDFCIGLVTGGANEADWHVSTYQSRTDERFYVVVHDVCGDVYTFNWNDYSQWIYNDANGGHHNYVVMSCNVSYAAMFPTEASQSDDGPTVQVNG